MGASASRALVCVERRCDLGTAGGRSRSGAEVEFAAVCWLFHGPRRSALPGIIAAKDSL